MMVVIVVGVIDVECRLSTTYKIDDGNLMVNTHM